MTDTETDPLTDWKGFYEELQNESPRAAVIIAGAFLDAQLRELISKSLIDDPKIVNKLLDESGPLSSFRSRIMTAYCTGLISKRLYDDLETIRGIRNKFAHKLHGYSFNDPEIVKWCKSLKLAKMITDAIPDFPHTHSDMFVLGVVQLASWLAMKTIEVERTHRPLPKGP